MVGISSTPKDVKDVGVVVIVMLPLNLEALSLQKTYILESDFILLQAHPSNSPDFGYYRCDIFAETDYDGLRHMVRSHCFGKCILFYYT